MSHLSGIVCSSFIQVDNKRFVWVCSESISKSRLQMPLSYLKLPKFLLIKSIVYSPTWSFAASIADVSAKVKALEDA